MHSAKKNRVLTYHISFWLSYVVFGVIMKASRDPDYTVNIGTNLILDVFLINSPTLFAFYASWYSYSKYLKPINLIRLSSSLLITLIVYTILWYLIDYWIAPKLNTIYTITSEFEFIPFVASILYIFVQWSLIAFGFQYFKKNLNQQKLLRVLQHEKLEIEYAFLRAQINPHFLNNTLNFFYAKSLPLSEELSNGIMTLSQIMRYSLQMDQNNQLVPLTHEIDHIKNIININELRFKNNLFIDLIVEGDIQNATIVPLTLVILIENILKHGDYSKQDARAVINLKIAKDKTLEIKTFNKKKSEQSAPPHGTSIENLQKRLRNYYGKKFNLSINDQDNFYELNLNIPLN